MLVLLVFASIFGGFVLRFRRESLTGYFGPRGREPGIFSYVAGNLLVLVVGATALWGSAICLLLLGNWAWAASGLILAFALQKPVFVWLYGKPKTKPAEGPQQSLAVPRPTLKYGLDGLREGISIESAIAILLAACNKPDTMFITDRWIQPKLEQLRSSLGDPLTPDQAGALRDAILQRVPFRDVLEWLSGEAVPWLEYQNRKREREARSKKEREGQSRKNWNPDHARRLTQLGMRGHIPPEVLFRKKEDNDRGRDS